MPAPTPRPPFHRFRTLTRLFLPSLSLASIAWALTPAPAAAAGFALDLVERAGGLDRPTAIAVPHDGSGRLFVTEKGGRVRIVDGSGLLPTPFLDLSAIVLDEFAERGLVGLAFHPDYTTNGLFYLAYVDLAGDAAVARYQASADPDVADPASGVVLLVVPQPSPIHNVNQLAFGPDGYLYVASGDGGPANDPDDNAQDLGLLLGKVLRLDVDHADPPLLYAIPPDNPFAGDPGARDEIWAWGLRNPSRFSFDRSTGDLWIADVGQHTWEEIDLQPAGSAGGENYGWRRREGNHCFDPPTGCEDPSFVPPVLEYPHSEGNCAVMGGYRYRGPARPHLAGAYLYTDWCSGRIWGATPRCRVGWRAEQLFDAPFQVGAFGEDEAGELVVAEWTETTARIFDVVASPTGGVFADGFETGDLGAWSGCPGVGF